MLNVAEALTLGTRHHQAGQLADAERIYRQVLTVEPDNPQALHLLGLLAMQGRQFEMAIELIGRAIRGDRRQATFHANLGEALRHAGRLDDAIAAYRTALTIQPGVAQIHVMLAGAQLSAGRTDEAIANLREALRLSPEDNPARTRLGHALHEQGQLSEAEVCFRRVLRADPRSAEAHFNLAGVLQSQSKHDDAAASYQTVLQLNPDTVEAHNNLGTLFRARGALPEAAFHFEQAIRIQHDYAPAQVNLGLIREIQGQLPTAADCFRAALAADPGCSLARNSLGAVMQKLGQIGEAIANYRDSVRIDPRDATARLGLACALQSHGNLPLALVEFDELARLQPDNAETHTRLGIVRHKLDQVDAAVEAFRRATQLRPDYAPAFNNLAACLHARGQIEQALPHLRRAVELAPGDSFFHSNLVHALNYAPHVDASTIYEEHVNWGRRHADPLMGQSSQQGIDCDPLRRLRVGYVSPNFRAQAISIFTEPIFSFHNHREFEIVCYSDVKQPDVATARFRSASDRWIETAVMTDAALAQQIAADRIDILVDLTGHLDSHRLLAFARKPAPVQVTYMGYQNTTGMRAMDYRITDDWSDPPGMTERFHTEELVRLPRAFFCYRPLAEAPVENAAPVFTSGRITFGSFNKVAKFNIPLLSTWAQILAHVPNSRLIVLAEPSDDAVERTRSLFVEHGVAGERVEFVGKRSRGEYLRLHQQVDIALDTFPFNGHTTVCEALWMGAPVVVLAGNTYVTRFGGSALVNLDLQELIAASPEEYIEIAVQLAGDVERLQTLRTGLRPRMEASPLLDAAGFTRHLETAYREMWTRWCSRQTV
jgi:predicted O-linked N-acetylglucosamine transferase (SPINDLY family)